MSCESNCRMENSLSMRSSLSVNPPSVNGNAFESSPSDTVLPVSLSMRSSLLPVTLFSQCHCQCVRVFLPVSLSMRSSLSPSDTVLPVSLSMRSSLSPSVTVNAFKSFFPNSPCDNWTHKLSQPSISPSLRSNGSHSIISPLINLPVPLPLPSIYISSIQLSISPHSNTHTLSKSFSVLLAILINPINGFDALTEGSFIDRPSIYGSVFMDPLTKDEYDKSFYGICCGPSTANTTF